MKHKIRLHFTIALIVSVLITGSLLYGLIVPNLLNNNLPLGPDVWALALISLIIGVSLLVGYISLFYKKNHKFLKNVDKVNILTQIYMGYILTISFCVAFFLMLLGIDITNSLLVISLTVLLLIFLTIRSYDRFLERKLSITIGITKARE